jgi:hypothetical protein
MKIENCFSGCPTVTLTTVAGANLYDCIDAAAIMAIRDSCIVVFVHNGHTYLAHPDKIRMTVVVKGGSEE